MEKTGFDILLNIKHGSITS